MDEHTDPCHCRPIANLCTVSWYSIRPLASIRIAISQSGDAFKANWDNGNPFPLSLPLTKADLDKLLPDLQRLYRDLTDSDDPTRLRGRLLLTCRPAETGLDGISGLGLAGLSRPDALHLLRGIVERREIDLSRPGYGRDAIEVLLERIEDHALSIELIAPHLNDLTPAEIASQLAERLHQFQDPSRAEGTGRVRAHSLRQQQWTDPAGLAQITLASPME